MDIFDRISQNLQRSGLPASHAEAITRDLFAIMARALLELGQRAPASIEAPSASQPPPAPAAPAAPTMGHGLQAAPSFWGGVQPRAARGISPAQFEAAPRKNVEVIHAAPPSSGRVEIIQPGRPLGSLGVPQGPYQGDLQPGETRVVIHNPDGTILTPRVGPGAPPGDLLFGGATPPVAAGYTAAPGVAPPAAPAAPAAPVVPVASSMAPGGLASEIASVRKANELSPSNMEALKAILENRLPDPGEVYSLTMLGLVVRGENGRLDVSQEGREAYYTATHLHARAAAAAAAPPEGAG